MRSLDEALREFVLALDELKMDYVIVGGIAVASWGNVRTTRDVDVIISLDKDKIERFVDVLSGHGFSATMDSILDSLKERSHFTIFDKHSEYHVDAKGVYSNRERRTLETKREVKIKTLKCYIAAPEDIIANKLVFGSEQDVKDAEGIYARQLPKLDLEYLERICVEMGIVKELEALKKRFEKYL
ncbi:MAG: DUF6036 family nucleotidyltransferase [Candidatus Hydrothermarchaeales archaeon]